jgi:hypothetical protein
LAVHQDIFAGTICLDMEMAITKLCMGVLTKESICEAEVNAAVAAAKDALHLKQLLIDLDVFDPQAPLQIGEDNSACIAQAESGWFFHPTSICWSLFLVLSSRHGSI